MAISNNADAFKMPCDMLTLSGTWPKEKCSKVYAMRGMLAWFLICGLCITTWMEAIKYITDMEKVSQILHIMVGITVTLIKLSAFTYKRETFLTLVNFLKDPVFRSYSDDLDHYMEKIIKFSTIMGNIYRYLVGLCIVLFIMFPLLDNKPLPFPFSFELGEYIFVMYVFQICSIAVSAWHNLSIDTLCMSLMGVGIAQLDILAEKIIRSKETLNMERYDFEITDDKDCVVLRNLNQCVAHHQAIIKFIQLIEEVFTVGLFFQFLGSVIILCYTVLKFVSIPISSEFLLLANYFVILMIQIFMYCWCGNEIMLKSVQIGEACYKSNWYLCGSRVRKSLFIIMERSKRPLIISTLRFSSLSLTAFISILNWSYSCLTLLLNMHSKTSTKG